ncbi:MAG: TIGR03557 family F420-dependent LLM class oxidoreductase [Nitrososphaerota archaeon]|nr:TIGR03557 family F420-dependent LLM class oxidoreductase [Nitrososphaerota archaeon]MDG6967486.1 TIGR03557 family F420-dependent LLM class oxidoreductase [Nitrososphaerota archaeon]MDG6978350.1 TIGR03557 family F420-dependent LLM class oxidoreductase [Nitrososphaerota archaeon]
MKGRPRVYYVLSSEQFPVAHLIEQGVDAERAGFDGVWASDHFQPWQSNEGHSGSAWVALSCLTQRTSRVAMGTGVTCPSFRYRPAVVAQVWASLSALAPGRVFLGLGSGENLNEGAAGGGWGKYRERASRLVEAVGLIRALWTGKEVHAEGGFWDVHGRLYDPPASRIPIYIAAGGPKSARLAGLHGDGLVTAASVLRSEPGVLSAWREAARESGRRAKPVVVEHWAVAGGEREAEYGAEKWRFLPKAFARGFFDSTDPSEIQSRAEAEVPLGRVLEDWTVSAEPRDHARAIEELADLGATHVVVHSPVADQRRAMAFFGRRVLSALR